MDSFGSHATIQAAGRDHRIARLDALEKRGMNLKRLPVSLRILLENLLRREDGVSVTAKDVEALVAWDPKSEPDREIAFTPARVILQDFTGVPAVVDLAAMRDAMRKAGGDPKKINPLCPVELVIDHSVQVDAFGTANAFAFNAEKDFERNSERYAFLHWGQKAFANFKVVPPATGIVHQVNLEYLARVVMAEGGWAYPDTLIGTDSHTTMINGLGVLGWGVGGIEAEAAMLGQPVSMLIPHVIGFRLHGELREGVTATDLVLRITELLRKKGVVGKFVEFFGSGLVNLPVADRATLSNMAPEYGATASLFPVDDQTIAYLRLSGRPEEQVKLVEAYMKEQGLYVMASTPAPEFTDVVELDLSSVESCLAGPKRPQDRVNLTDVKRTFQAALPTMMSPKAQGSATPTQGNLSHGSVVIAAITSCTNTSNPSVMLAAGIVAKKAVERGLSRKPWVKTSLAPGSKVVTDYLKESGLAPFLDQLGFNLVGYGCTTCIGNSGPLPKEVSSEIEAGDLVAVSVLSGNRNFEGRVHSEVRANYLASPPLVVAYALAGRIDLDLTTEPIGTGKDGRPVYLKEIWPTRKEVADTMARVMKPEMYRARYSDVYAGDERWRAVKSPSGDTYAWDGKSTYVKHPPYFEGMGAEAGKASDLAGARALLVLGDSITTDHISPAGEIDPESPAGMYLQSLGVKPADFNSYGSRRGNHEVMMRGTFGNVRLKNALVPGVEGSWTAHQPDGAKMSVYDASVQYRSEGVPLVILAGKEYGSGSSRDWAAKGPSLLGVRAVVAESYERIHRSNLVGMGIAPLQLKAGASVKSLGLTGKETFDVVGLAAVINGGLKSGRDVTGRAKRPDGTQVEFPATVRIDTPQEVQYYLHGGILRYVLRRLNAR